MAKINLKPLSLKELEALQVRVKKAIGNHEKKNKTKALAAVKAKAKQLGFSLSELTGGSVAKATPAAKPRKKAAKLSKKPAFRDTDNPKNTWIGRGPRPQWLKDALANGKSVEDFRI